MMNFAANLILCKPSCNTEIDKYCKFKHNVEVLYNTILSYLPNCADKILKKPCYIKLSVIYSTGFVPVIVLLTIL